MLWGKKSAPCGKLNQRLLAQKTKCLRIRIEVEIAHCPVRVGLSKEKKIGNIIQKQLEQTRIACDSFSLLDVVSNITRFCLIQSVIV